MLAFLTSGCVTRKPLPYQFSQPLPPITHGPELAIAPTKNSRVAKDNMDKVLYVPGCLDGVLLKELEGAGIFKSVTLNTNGIAADQYLLEPSLVDLRWEVPNYNSKLATAFTVSLLTGGIGGLAYGSTGTEVLGHATVHVKLTDVRQKQIILERDYQASSKDKRSKFNCDTPTTYREMAAAALKEVIDELKNDLRKLTTAAPKPSPAS